MKSLPFVHINLKPQKDIPFGLITSTDFINGVHVLYHPPLEIVGWFSNRTGALVEQVLGKEWMRFPVPNLPLYHWSSQLFDLCAPSSTDVPCILLLNQPSVTLNSFILIVNEGVSYHGFNFCICGQVKSCEVNIQVTNLWWYFYNAICFSALQKRH